MSDAPPDDAPLGGMDAPPPAESVPVHESPEIATRRTALVAAWIAGAFVVVLLLAAGVLAVVGGSPESQVKPLPHAPRLSGEPGRELAELRAREDELLGSYAWVDRDADVVRVPIERAMELLVERERRR
jgi:hypothetical protein